MMPAFKYRPSVTANIAVKDKTPSDTKLQQMPAHLLEARYEAQYAFVYGQVKSYKREKIHSIGKLEWV